MFKKLLTGALTVATLALTILVASPGSAEARIVCRSGWGWHGGRCMEVRRMHYVPHHHYYRHHHGRVVYVR